MSEIQQPEGWQELVARGKARLEDQKTSNETSSSSDSSLIERVAGHQKRIDALLSQLDENVKKVGVESPDEKRTRLAAEELQSKIDMIRQKRINGEDI